MVKEEAVKVYVTSDGKNFSDLLKALNHEENIKLLKSEKYILRGPCEHLTTLTKKVFIKITISQGCIDVRTATFCRECGKILKMG